MNKERELFYSFSAGPGELRVIVDCIPGSGHTVHADVTIEDKDAKRLVEVSTSAHRTSGSTRKVERVQLEQARPLLLVIRTRPYDAESSGSYRIRLEGAVALSAAKDEPPRVAATGENALLHVVLPRQGVMSVELDDGTVTQIDLRRVRRVSVKP